MFSVFIMAKIEAGKEDEVLNFLESVKQIERTSLTYGIYDLCIQASFRTMEELNNFVFNNIRKIVSIKETVTLISARTIFPQSERVLSFG